MAGSPQSLNDLVQGLRAVNAGSDQVLTGERVTLQVLPLATDLNTHPDFPVRVGVKWSLRKVADDGTESPFTEFDAPDGLTAPTLRLLFRPNAVAGATQPKVRVRVYAQVQLGSFNQTSDWTTLPAVSLYLITPVYLNQAVARLAERLEIVQPDATEEYTAVLPAEKPVRFSLREIPGARPLPADVPLRTEVEWSVLQDGHELVRSQDYAAPLGLRTPDLTLLFPARVDLGQATPTPLALALHARVRVSAGDLTSPYSDLPLLPLSIARRPDPAAVLAEIEAGTTVLQFGDATVAPGGAVSFAIRQVSGLLPPADLPVATSVTWQVTGAALPAYRAEGANSAQFALQFLPQETNSRRTAEPVPFTVQATVRLTAGGAVREFTRSTALSAVRLVESAAV